MNRNKIFNKKRGSIAITIVMLVFCLLMSVSMSYHKTIQTETMVQNSVNFSDRAVDAAFSGINYAMAVIQSNKKVFRTTTNPTPTKVMFVKSEDSTIPNSIQYISSWINLATTATFTTYLDDDRQNDQLKQHPPYRFKIACASDSYLSDHSKVYIKSCGEYLKYDDQNNTVSSYTAQLMAECILDSNTKTIRLNKYRKMPPQDIDNADTFFSFKENNDGNIKFSNDTK